jgi:AraC family transcriptional regulator, regulatory protein of adaptative response / methylphosphotriester-DNA alkyltransferase methyltransferase
MTLTPEHWKILRIDDAAERGFSKSVAVHTTGPVRPLTIERRRQLWRDAAREIDRRYAEPLTVAAVAHAIGTSSRQLQRVFEESGSGSFRSHLAAVRMDRAKELLLADDATVRSVAARVGYSQPAQFAKAFRRHHGVAPSELRRNGNSSS